MGQMSKTVAAFNSGSGATPQRASSPASSMARQPVLPEWNRTETVYPEQKYLPRMIEEQAARTPNAEALLFEDQVLSYSALNHQANQLARHLQKLGVGPESRVAICSKRSLEMVVGLLAILKAGGAYLPVDPEYPAERVSWMLDDAQPAVLLTQTSILKRLPPYRGAVLCLDGDLGPIRQEPDSNLQSPILGANAAYVIYTSGSTGRPKGAVNTHSGICNRLLWMQEMYRLTAADRVLQKTSFSFDVSVWEFFWPLMTGAGLVLARPGGHRDSGYLVDTIQRYGVTTLHFVPSMLNSFLEEPRVFGCSTLRNVICSGEALSASMLERFHARCRARLHNLYGPTEAAIDVTFWECPKEFSGHAVPIGRPIANMQVHVLDGDMQPAAVGEEGELYIGGIGLARGYLNRPELTAECFLPNPFAVESGARLYRTGDLGRWTPDGTIEFQGRADTQVKLRGYRIELEEIAAVLCEHPDVQDAVVVAYERTPGDKQLVAYVVPQRASARHVLGSYLLPNGLRIEHQNKNETDYLYQEIFESNTYLRHGIRLEANACVFDVGANIGMFALFVSELVPNARIYAFEPIPPIFATLQANAALCTAQVKTFGFGLSDKEGTEEFICYPRNTIMSGLRSYTDREQDMSVVKKLIENERRRTEALDEIDAEIEELLAGRFDQQSHQCRVRRLSDVIAENGIDRIDLLKVDVERAELEVLRGIAAGDWAKIEQVVVEAEDKLGSSARVQQIVAFLRERCYDVTIDEDERLRGSGLHNIYALRRKPGSRTNGDKTPGSATAVPPGSSALLSVAALRSHVLHKLPDYMAPAAYVFLKALPVTVNGKLDRKALPPPSEERPALEQPYVAPRTEIEETLARIWAEVLHVSCVGVHDNFLHLGGHSLLAAQVISRVQKIYSVHLSLRSFFDKPTLAGLAESVQQGRKDAGRPEAPAILPIPREADIPLSFSQERVWFLLQFEPSSIAYHFQGSLRISGLLDVPALERGLSEILHRHEILRTTFMQKDGRPVQVIHEAQPFSLPVVKVTPADGKSAAEMLDLLMRQELEKKFDVGRLPLIRWTLFALSDRDFLLLDVEHHFVHDGWGFNVFVGELLTLYKAFTAGQPLPLPPPVIQFADFAVWQRQLVAGDPVNAQLDYWTKKLAGVQPVSEFPADRPRPPVQTFRGGLIRLPLPLDISRKARAFSSREGASLFVTMMAAFFSLIYRCSGQDDLCVGSTVANRQNPGTEGLLGMLVNNLVLRTQILERRSFQDFVAQVRDVTLEAYENQDAPFHHVVQALGLERNLSVNPLFQTMFNFHTSPLTVPDLPELTFELTEGLSNGSAKFDVSIIVIPAFEQRLRLNPAWNKDDVVMLWEFNSDLFDEATIRRMIGWYESLLESLVANPGRRITEASLLTQPERQQILNWNRTSRQFDAQSCVHQLFEEQAAGTPGKIAVEHLGEALTYQELNRRANRLARYLRKLGVENEVRVGINMERCADAVVGLLAVLKAGGAYVPMDPALPADRLEYMLEDANIAVLLVKGAGKGRLPAGLARTVSLEGHREQISAQSDGNLERTAHPENLAYVIYTSGSTGKPKGVMIQHRSLVNLLQSVRQDLGITSRDTLLALTTLSFDIAALEIFSPILAGGCLLMADAMQEEMQSLSGRVREQNVSIMQATPTLWKLLSEQSWQPGAVELMVLCGGEAMEKTLAAQLLKISTKVWNMYGPTETTVWSSMYRVQNVPEGIAFIGKPIANTEMYVLDDQMTPAPAGVPGHLYIGGAGLARGYMNRADLTAEKFLPNPFSITGGDRLYHTGDLARWRPDGNLEFLGRKDFQVKLRGYRIELGEIEAALLQHPGIKGAVAVVKEDESKEKRRLVAYLVASGGQAIPTSALQAHLRKSLPEYMVPSQLVVLDEIPVTPNGKVDRKTLSARLGDNIAVERSYEAPRTPLENALALIWAEILGLEQVGIYDNFFTLGGHSLLAAQVISRIRALCQVDLPMRTVFEKATIALLADAVESALIEKVQSLSEEETQQLLEAYKS